MEMFRDFQEFRKILCVCPDCNTLVRVSDLKLIIKEKDGNTWLDKYEKKNSQMNLKEEKFEEIKSKSREEAVNKGRIEAGKVFNKAINPTFKALKYNPFDLKPILNPIDFIVFKDMDKKDVVNDIVLLSEKIKNNFLNTIRAQIKNCVTKKNYEWQVARINEKGKIELD